MCAASSAAIVCRCGVGPVVERVVVREVHHREAGAPEGERRRRLGAEGEAAVGAVGRALRRPGGRKCPLLVREDEIPVKEPLDPCEGRAGRALADEGDVTAGDKREGRRRGACRPRRRPRRRKPREGRCGGSQHDRYGRPVPASTRPSHVSATVPGKGHSGLLQGDFHPCRLCRSGPDATVRCSCRAGARKRAGLVP